LGRTRVLDQRALNLPSQARCGAPHCISSVATQPALAYDLFSSSEITWTPDTSGPAPPTCVLVHGILGSRRNLLSFAKRLVAEHPRWQFLLVDLRCHGQSCTLPRPPEGPNTVESAAKDVISLLNQLRIYPQMLIGHSFGGKVVMQMVALSTPILPKPVQMWVLDTVPGDTWCDGGDHPRDTIRFCRTLALPFDSRKQLVEQLTGGGFTLGGAQWMTTNLRPCADGFEWAFDLEGISEMYASYEGTDLWPMVANRPKGLSLGFVRAEQSAFLWTDDVVRRLGELGASVHLLPDSSHWVHTDNPEGLQQIMAPSFSRLLRE